MPERYEAGICLYRSLQCGEIEPHQYALPQQETGEDIGHAGKDAAHQPFHHQQRVVSGGPARLWLCEAIEEGDRAAGPDDSGIYPPTGTAGERVRAGGYPTGAPENRPGVHGVAGRVVHPVFHHLHQGRQVDCQQMSAGDGSV